MDNTAIYNELLSLEASARVLAEKAERLRLKLPGSSLPGNQKTRGGLSDEEKVKLIAKRQKRLKHSK
ncbi:hypothetical protein SAE01_12160 [Segetibacter aerophilus]|uniref:Uncharacterized protein n=1 Tax=Segetibacter aerophilus TaxID=670293 RepID=A0A512B9S7_9BACT|nr:hypothetical protein SAE01_12160 [Segetibacter aerophilus]